MQFRLSETDRKHYAMTDEWIEYEYQRFTNREADLIEDPDGPGMDPSDWLEALKGEILEVKGVPQINDKTGEPLKILPPRTLDALIWLGVRRAGVLVAWADWEYDRIGVELRWRDDPEPEEGEGEPGKDEPEQETSPG